MCSLGIEPTTFCAADAMLYHWATQEHLYKKIMSHWQHANVRDNVNGHLFKLKYLLLQILVLVWIVI